MRKAYLQMHFAILLWGFTAIFGKAISLDEVMLVWYRMLFSSVATFIFLLYIKQFQVLPRMQLLKIAGIGGLLALHWITFYGAIKASNVSIAISCFSSLALFTALIDPLINRKLPKGSELLLGIGVMIGIYIIFSVQQIYYKGIILALLSAMLAAIVTVLNKKISGKFNPELITFYELGAGFLILSALLPIWFQCNSSAFSIPGTKDILLLILLSVFCTTVAFTLSLYALKKLDSFTMSLSINLEPLYSIILAMIIFKEQKMLNTGFYIGSVVILSAVALHGFLELRKKNQAK